MSVFQHRRLIDHPVIPRDLPSDVRGGLQFCGLYNHKPKSINFQIFILKLEFEKIIVKMGVTRLEWYVDKHNLYKQFQLTRGQTVVIDGSSLLHSLCTETVLYGGEYQSLYETCKKFFTKMGVDAGIWMVIVMDGAWADAKLERIKQTHTRKLRKIKDLTDEEDQEGFYHFQPAFAMKCFSDALAEIERVDSVSKMMVEIITAPFEADIAVAREAIKTGSPVLANDSDMIVFNLPQGYIKLSSLKWMEIQEDATYVKCKRVISADVASELEISVDQLPLFATLRESIRYDTYRQGPRTNDTETVFSWISRLMRGETDETVMRSVRLGHKHLEKMRNMYRSYNLQDEEVNPRDHDIPDRIRHLLDGGKLYHGALVVWLQGMFIPTKQVEDFSKPSSNDVSRDLRCMWYSIICAGERDEVKELYRKSGTTDAVEERVELKRRITLNDGTKIDLTQPDDLDATKGRKLLLYALECEDEAPDLSEWPNDPTMEIPARVTTFWRKKTNPDPHIQRALVDFLTKPNDVLEEDQTPPSFNLSMAHAYAQWQSCLMAAYDLNIILGSPLPDFKIYPLLGNGSALHHMCNILAQEDEA